MHCSAEYTKRDCVPWNIGRDVMGNIRSIREGSGSVRMYHDSSGR